jgi:hypothetical protein
MARLNNDVPDPRIAVVRPDAEKDYFEVYLMKPINVGAVTRIATSNYGTNDGFTGFKTVADALQHIMSKRGEHEIASNVGKYTTTRRGTRKPPTSQPVPGATLLRAGVWLDYCKAYNRDPGVVKPSQLYPITLEEREKWGIE